MIAARRIIDMKIRSLDLQAMHRVRDRLVSRRTAVINQLRAFLLERGITFPKGPASLRRQMPEILEDGEQQLSPRMRGLLAMLWQEWSFPTRSAEENNQDERTVKRRA
jgi:transposase